MAAWTTASSTQRPSNEGCAIHLSPGQPLTVQVRHLCRIVADALHGLCRYELLLSELRNSQPGPNHFVAARVTREHANHVEQSERPHCDLGLQLKGES